jgi:hypothetical protein
MTLCFFLRAQPSIQSGGEVVGYNLGTNLGTNPIKSLQRLNISTSLYMLEQSTSYIEFFLPQPPGEFEGLREIETDSTKLMTGIIGKVIQCT